MTRASAVPWLPPPCDGEMERAVAGLAQAWLADWLVEAPPVQAVPRPAALAEHASWRGRPGGRVAAAPNDVVALGLAACAGRARPDNPSDREVLAGIADDMLDDLVRRIGLGMTPQSGGADNVAERLFGLVPVSGDWEITLALDGDAIVGLRKALAGTSRHSGSGHAAPVPLADALADERVNLGCHLGEARLTAGDVAALVVGDLLVLDRAITAPLPLTVEGVAAHRGSASIAAARSAAGGAIRATIAEPPLLFRKA